MCRVSEQSKTFKNIFLHLGPVVLTLIYCTLKGLEHPKFSSVFHSFPRRAAVAWISMTGRTVGSHVFARCQLSGDGLAMWVIIGLQVCQKKPTSTFAVDSHVPHENCNCGSFWLPNFQTNPTMMALPSGSLRCFGLRCFWTSVVGEETQISAPLGENGDRTWEYHRDTIRCTVMGIFLMEYHL